MRGGEGNAEDQLGVVKVASALLGRALRTISDAAWTAFFNLLTAFRSPPPTPEQLYEQHLREREAAITHYLKTHRRGDQ